MDPRAYYCTAAPRARARAQGRESENAGTDAGVAGHMHVHVGGCQNYGPFLGPYYNTAPNI